MKEVLNDEKNLLQNTAVMKRVMFDLMTSEPSILKTKYNMVKPWFLFKRGNSEDVISRKLIELVSGRFQWTYLH